MNHNEKDPRLIRAITLHNILSYGPHTAAIPLRDLNVLIGPNASGKSNLIEALTLLRATPSDVRSIIRRGGGVKEWIWKGASQGTARIEAIVHNPQGSQSLRHLLAFYDEAQRFRLADERIENEKPNPGYEHPYFYYHYQQGRPVLNVQGDERPLAQETVDPDLSILAQRRDPEAYPEVSYLASVYEKVRVYREWSFGHHAVFRDPQQADMRNDRLEEDFSNLGLFLNRLRRVPQAKHAILTGIRDLYDGFTDFDISIEGGTVQVFFTEGDFIIPATRLSDGTLRYLCLLAILCDPEPPPLICIEEPELGLHPDVLPKIADLLIDAAERTQLIITTHSDILVDALTDYPEALLICEKPEDRTLIRRLSHEALAPWLEAYRLGELWTRGELGGTRW
jgi:predicted ATPase